MVVQREALAPVTRRIHVGGTIPVEDCVYVPRPEEARFLELVRPEAGRLARPMRAGTWVHVAAPRTMGKSSLVAHAREALEQEGIRVVYADLEGDVGDGPKSLVRWCEALGEHLAFELGIPEETLLEPVRALRGREGDIAPALPLRRLLVDGALAQIGGDGRLLLELDELDVLEGLPYAADIVTGFRNLFQARHREPALQRLVVCFLGLRPLNELADPRSGSVSPFGETIWLTDFPAQDTTIDAIAAGFLPEPDPRPAIRYLLEQTGGQPLITMSLASRAANGGLTTPEHMKRLVDTYLTEQRTRPSDTFLQIQNYLVAHREDGIAALSTYRNLLMELKAARDPDAPGAELLRRSGLVRNRDDRLEVKSPIHRRHFDDEWAARTLSEISRHLQNLVRSAAVAARLARRTGAGKICVINTGGTVGMVQREGRVVAAQNPQEFMEYFGEIEEVAEVDFLPLFKPVRDSINMYPPDWVTIARAIYERRHEGYVGFVVAHGTDTMAYSASAVAFALGEQLRFPVVFTGAQTTPDVKHGDARVNLYRACLVAVENIPEVVICFGNHVFRGCRAQKKDERKFDGFESPSYPPLANITEGIDVQRRLVRSVQIDESKLRPVPETYGEINLRASFATGVLQIGLYPGLDPKFYDRVLDEYGPEAEGTLRGVILQTLGAGNVPSLEPYSFVGFIEKATRLGIPVVVASPFPVYGSASDPRFAPAKEPLEKGAITVGNMTTAAAVTKFQWVLAQVAEREQSGEVCGAEARRKEVEKMMNTSYIGEVDLDPTSLMF